MPDFLVTWQMTGETVAIDVADELDAKTKIDAMSDEELIQVTTNEIVRVIAVRTPIAPA
jgi:hypothetical protein